MRKGLMYDTIDLADSKVEVTSDGYLKALPRIARTGIQLYRGFECGRDDLDFVRVYRPEDSVFARQATHSYTHLPITVDHPSAPVSADNWKKLAVGETGDEVLRDGGSVRVPMMLRDAAAIKLVKNGKRELSVGYNCDLLWGDGYTPGGEQYDAMQTNIRANHLAIVSQARGGSTLAIGDKAMSDNLRTIMVDGLPVQMSDKDGAIVQRTIQKLTTLADQFEAFKKKSEEENEEEEKAKKDSAEQVKAKDALIATLQAQLKDATDPNKLDAQLADRDVARQKARALMGGTFKADGRSIADIKREVVVAKSGVAAARNWGDAEIAAVFDHLAASVGQPQRNAFADASAAFGSPSVADGQAIKDAAYAEYVKELQNGWKLGKQ
jgi:uncharacterized protein